MQKQVLETFGEDPTERVLGNRWNVVADFDNPCQVLSTLSCIAGQGFTDASPIKCQEIDQLWKTTGQSNDTEHLAQLRGSQVVDVVQHDDERPVTSLHRLFDASTLRHDGIDVLGALQREGSGSTWLDTCHVCVQRGREGVAIPDQLISKLPLGLAEDTQLRGDLLEEGPDELLALGEHPRVELKDRSDWWNGQLFDDQVQ
jgi:hypothetical protein